MECCIRKQGSPPKILRRSQGGRAINVVLLGGAVARRFIFWRGGEPDTKTRTRSRAICDEQIATELDHGLPGQSQAKPQTGTFSRDKRPKDLITNFGGDAWTSVLHKHVE